MTRLSISLRPPCARAAREFWPVQKIRFYKIANIYRCGHLFRDRYLDVFHDGTWSVQPRPAEQGWSIRAFSCEVSDASEYIIGLATGSIVLLVGSSALHGQSGRLPWFYASPLLLLAFCVIYGVAFMVWLIYNYEERQHGNPHTRFAYAFSLTLGFFSRLLLRRIRLACNPCCGIAHDGNAQIQSWRSSRGETVRREDCGGGGQSRS
jgi:hypothetical protein